jgi:prepilin-type processing-associated H-X9-DG protein
MVYADKNPKPDLSASASLWWLNGNMDPSNINGQHEGVDTTRHNGGKWPGVGNVGFSDGHAESRKDANINPPVDPGQNSSAKALINSQYWDPRQAAGQQ